MVRIILLLFILIAGTFNAYPKDTSVTEDTRPIALIYSGPGVCEENCTKAAAHVVQKERFKIDLVNNENFVLLEKAKLWVQPGGDAVVVAKALKPKKLTALKTFIKNGGSYLGFCAGAFLADHKVDDALTIDGLGLIPGVTKDYFPEGKKTGIFPVLWENQMHYLYFEDGGYFDLIENNAVKVIAKYMDGKTAAIFFPYEKGKVALSFPHPEATLEWKNSNNLIDPDGEDFDLAQQLVRYLY
ncbi:MAG: hypothetical protein HY843_01600 [Bdellovibrio sp.]|nr:hypothetical protein [Bdellovibrio sp.]